MERRRKQKSDRAPQNPLPLITVCNRQKAVSIQTASVRRLVYFFLQEMKVRCKELCIHFVGVRTSSKIHAQFFDDPSPTDCMTFPIDNQFLGECMICPEIALEQNPKDPHFEISHYLLHCLLHLIGYEDIDKSKRAIMRKEERRLLKLARNKKCLLEP